MMKKIFFTILFDINIYLIYFWWVTDNDLVSEGIVFS